MISIYLKMTNRELMEEREKKQQSRGNTEG